MFVPPRAEEKISGCFETKTTSSWRVTAQKPGPPCGSVCQWTGSSRRSTAKASWGTPATKLSGLARSTSSRRILGPPAAPAALPGRSAFGAKNVR